MAFFMYVPAGSMYAALTTAAPGSCSSRLSGTGTHVPVGAVRLHPFLSLYLP
jgi:hypothetical protein